jgi:predicted kinase
MPTLLVVSGLPAAGKSHLAAQLSPVLGWPVVSKDDAKAILHRHLPDLTHAQAGPLSFELMYHTAGVILQAGGSVLLETHFHLGLSEPKLLTLAQAHAARLGQIYCTAPLEVLRERHAARVAAGARPQIDLPGVHDQLSPQAGWAPLALDAPLLRLDTTRPLDRPALLAWVRMLAS